MKHLKSTKNEGEELGNKIFSFFQAMERRIFEAFEKHEKLKVRNWQTEHKRVLGQKYLERNNERLWTPMLDERSKNFGNKFQMQFERLG